MVIWVWMMDVMVIDVREMKVGMGAGRDVGSIGPARGGGGGAW